MHDNLTQAQVYISNVGYKEYSSRKSHAMTLKANQVTTLESLIYGPVVIQI